MNMGKIYLFLYCRKEVHQRFIWHLFGPSSKKSSVSFDWNLLGRPCVPSNVPFKIIVQAYRMIMVGTIIDEGASMSILSSTAWKLLGLPLLLPEIWNLSGFNKGTSWPFGILPNLPINLRRKTVHLNVMVGSPRASILQSTPWAWLHLYHGSYCFLTLSSDVFSAWRQSGSPSWLAFIPWFKHNYQSNAINNSSFCIRNVSSIASPSTWWSQEIRWLWLNPGGMHPSLLQ